MQYKVSIVKISWHIKILQSVCLWFHPQMKARNKSWQHSTVTSHPILMNSWKTIAFSLADIFWHPERLFILPQPSWREDNQLAFNLCNISNFCVKFLSGCHFFQKSLFLFLSAGEGSWRRVCMVTSCSSTMQVEVRPLLTRLLHSFIGLIVVFIFALSPFLLRGGSETWHVQWPHPHRDLSHPVRWSQFTGGQDLHRPLHLWGSQWGCAGVCQGNRPLLCENRGSHRIR